jgi:hypothetical protein
VKKQKWIDRLGELVKLQHQVYLDMGEALKEVRARTSSYEYAEILTRLGLSYRRARYFIILYETAERLEITREDSLQLGWTKFSIIAPILTASNKDAWVETARATTVLELRALVRKALGEIDGGEIGVSFVLTKNQEARLFNALVQAGAVQHGCGLLFKGEALDVIISDWLGT